MFQAYDNLCSSMLKNSAKLHNIIIYTNYNGHTIIIIHRDILVSVEIWIVVHEKNLTPASESSGLDPGINSALPCFASAWMVFFNIHSSIPENSVQISRQQA